MNETVSTNTPISPVSGKVRWEEKGAVWHLSTHSSNATPYSEDYEGISVSVPKTVVLCTDLFDEFMESNNLYQIALSDMPDEEILNHFLEASLPERLKEDILAFFEVVGRPIAVRSSSLLEDSHYQPFAGVYSTYMIPFLEDREEMYRMLSAAVKAYMPRYFTPTAKPT